MSEALGLVMTAGHEGRESSPSLKATHVGTAHLSSFRPCPVCLEQPFIGSEGSTSPPRANSLTPGHWLPSNSRKGKSVSTYPFHQHRGNATEGWLKPWCQRRPSVMAPDSLPGETCGGWNPRGLGSDPSTSGHVRSHTAPHTSLHTLLSHY